MENFIVSARKYRPSNFKSVVGQDAITSTLKNAIKNKQLGHAYLFNGPRGVGKTTCARIFAKTINCQNMSDKIEACNECESCKSFNENRAYNIHELDAASNNSVDDIRSLTEQVRIPPQIGKYSLYIIDEVHMLSAQAFNAFLKTLEEPPAHAIFILATTEKHKIIPTILSRCQIYDFNRIRTEDAVEYLKYIAKEEGVDYEDDALHVIAQKADGAMRDALSIFDQVVSFTEHKMTYEQVIENLNILNIDYYFKLTGHFMENDLSGTLLTFDEILADGFDSRNFMNGLASFLRDLLVAKNPETIILLDVGSSMKDKYKELAAGIPVDFIYEALDICNVADIQYRGSKNQRLTIELALIKLANLTEVQKKKLAKKDIQEAPPEKPAQQKPSIDKSLEKKENPAPIVGQQSKVNAPEQELSTTKTSETTDTSKEEKTREPAQVVHTKSVSIKGVLNAVTRDIPVKDDVIDEDDQVSKIESTNEEAELELTTELLLEKWENYALSVEKSLPRVFNTLKQHKPKLDQQGKIALELTSNAQKEHFIHQIKPELVRYLKKNLANLDYEFDISILEEEKATKMVYTDHDKLDYMIAKNADLQKLKNRFNLDFDD